MIVCQDDQLKMLRTIPGMCCGPLNCSLYYGSPGRVRAQDVRSLCSLLTYAVGELMVKGDGVEVITMVIIRITAFLVKIANIYILWARPCSKHFLFITSFRIKGGQRNSLHPHEVPCPVGEIGQAWQRPGQKRKCYKCRRQTEEGDSSGSRGDPGQVPWRARGCSQTPAFFPVSWS